MSIEVLTRLENAKNKKFSLLRKVQDLDREECFDSDLKVIVDKYECEFIDTKKELIGILLNPRDVFDRFSDYLSYCKNLNQALDKNNELKALKGINMDAYERKIKERNEAFIEKYQIEINEDNYDKRLYSSLDGLKASVCIDYINKNLELLEDKDVLNGLYFDGARVIFDVKIGDSITSFKFMDRFDAFEFADSCEAIIKIQNNEVVPSSEYSKINLESEAFKSLDTEVQTTITDYINEQSDKIVNAALEEEKLKQEQNADSGLKI